MVGGLSSGSVAVPAYHDDEYKALQPDNEKCSGDGGFRTTLTDPVTDYVTILSHESKYIQVWTGAKSTFGVDAEGIHKLKGRPFTVSELVQQFKELIG